MLIIVLALLVALLPSFLVTSALPIPPAALTHFDPLADSLPPTDLSFDTDNVYVDEGFSPRALKQATRAEVVARQLAADDLAAKAAADASAIEAEQLPAPGDELSENAKRSQDEVVLAAPQADCEKALSVVDFSTVCAPITILDPASAAAFVQGGGVVRYKDGAVYTDPQYTASTGDENSPLRAVIQAYGSGRRSLPFFTRWAMIQEREGSTLLALSPNTAVRIGDLKEIGRNLLSYGNSESVKVVGVTFDWRTMQAIVDNITF